MIHVTIDVLPFGQAPAQQIAELKIWNTGEGAEIWGIYRARLDDGPVTGTFEHCRADGAVVLVQKALEMVLDDKIRTALEDTGG